MDSTFFDRSKISVDEYYGQTKPALDPVIKDVYTEYDVNQANTSRPFNEHEKETIDMGSKLKLQENNLSSSYNSGNIEKQDKTPTPSQKIGIKDDDEEVGKEESFDDKSISIIKKHEENEEVDISLTKRKHSIKTILEHSDKNNGQSDSDSSDITSSQGEEQIKEKVKQNIVITNLASNEASGNSQSKSFESKMRKYVLRPDEITLHDYEQLRPEDAILYDTRSFCKYYIDEVIQHHSLVSLFLKQSILDPSYMRVFKFVIICHYIYGFNAIFCTDDYIDLIALKGTVILLKLDNLFPTSISTDATCNSVYKYLLCSC
jgi:hypothetical protein